MFTDIIRRHTHEGKFNLANALVEIEERLIALEEGLMFFSTWYNKTQRGPEILIPDHLKDNSDQYISEEALKAIQALKGNTND